jgi:hypothetical protein
VCVCVFISALVHLLFKVTVRVLCFFLVTVRVLFFQSTLFPLFQSQRQEYFFFSLGAGAAVWGFYSTDTRGTSAGGYRFVS